MPLVVSLPSSNRARNSFSTVNNQRMGFAQLHNSHSKEDGLLHSDLQVANLSSNALSLSAADIGQRLWTSYKILNNTLDAPDFQSGTTASTTVCNGTDTFITATLGDSSVFAICHTVNGAMLVLRLNSTNHTVSTPNETVRIRGIYGKKVSVIRSTFFEYASHGLGDGDMEGKLRLSSDAQIDIVTKTQIAQRLQIPVGDIASMQILSTTVDFTRNEPGHSIIVQEQCLLSILNAIPNAKDLNETELAKAVANSIVQKNRWKFNISVLISHVSGPFIQGVYNGHNGFAASSYVAENMVDVFLQQCQLSLTDYALQALSVNRLQASVVPSEPAAAIPAKPATKKRTALTEHDPQQKKRVVRRRARAVEPAVENAVPESHAEASTSTRTNLIHPTIREPGFNYTFLAPSRPPRPLIMGRHAERTFTQIATEDLDSGDEQYLIPAEIPIVSDFDDDVTELGNFF